MIEEVFAVIDELEKAETIKEIRKVKKQIKESEHCKSIIRKFEENKNLYEKYSNQDDFIDAKKALYENEYIGKYLRLQSEINDMSFYINEKFKSLSKNTACNK